MPALLADGESFFENLQQPEPPAPLPSRTSTLSPRPATSEEHHAEAGESEGDIQRALYVGNYEAAVNICLQVSVALHVMTKAAFCKVSCRKHIWWGQPYCAWCIMQAYT